MGFLTDKEIAELAPSEFLPYATPIPTQIVSSDEFTPPPQSEKQKEVENRLLAMADELGGKQGLSRRQFFQSAAGMAAGFVALNETFGTVFDASRAEAATPAMAQERAASLKDQFIMDMHTHFLRDDTRLTEFRAFARGGRQGRLESGAGRQAADARRSQVQQLFQGNVSRQRHQDRSHLVVAVGNCARLVPHQQDDDRGARQGEQGSRFAAHVRACDLHARLGRLARSARSRAARTSRN